MNVLYISYLDMTRPLVGGIERVVNGNARCQVANWNIAYYSIQFVSTTKVISVENCAPCKEMVRLPQGWHTDICKYLMRWNIDVILCSDIEYIEVLHTIIQEMERKPKIVFNLHFNIGVERIWLWWTIRHYVSRLDMRHQTVKKLWWVARYSAQRIWKTVNIPSTYRKAYELSDKVVLLSESFIPPYVKFAKLKESSKLTFINNSNTYSVPISDDKLSAKKNIVLVVCRLEENQKRVSLCLKIWEKIEHDCRLDDWQLKIVGTGLYAERYKTLAHKLKLRRISFEGHQDPKPYYEEAKIFMMTSRYEGWGLTLTEAHQMGVVPIAMDSYESLRDIIINGENGFIVPNSDTTAFANTMAGLMMNPSLCTLMARRAVDLSVRFTAEKVNAKWNELFEELVG